MKASRARQKGAVRGVAMDLTLLAVKPYLATGTAHRGYNTAGGKNVCGRRAAGIIDDDEEKP